MTVQGQRAAPFIEGGCAVGLVTGKMPWQVNILLGRVKLGSGPQPKEMDEINPESPRANVPPVAYLAPVVGMPAERGAGAADREHRA